MQNVTLIKPKEVLKILTFVSRRGLYSGARETSRLTKFPVGKQTLYSKEECERLRDEIIETGKAAKEIRENREVCPTRLY